MTGSITEISGQVIFMCAEVGQVLQSPRDATDIVGGCYGYDVRWVVIPTSRLADSFFDLSTRIAGEFLQKLINYQLRVAIVGDISMHENSSSALRDFVRESNRGESVWFKKDMEALVDAFSQQA